jgi:hypothetical protein
MAKTKPRQLLEARDALVDLRCRQNPQGSRAAAAREVMAELGPKGRRLVSEAERQVARKRSRKAAAESAKRSESVKRRVDRAVAEALARPGVREALAAKTAGAAAELTGISGGELTARYLTASSEVSQAPFWRSGPDAPGGRAPTAPGPAQADLAAMDADQLRSYASGQFKALATAGGLGGPVWADA